MDANISLSALSHSKSRAVWAGYFPNHTDAAIRARFESVYGYPPAQVVRQASIVLCGPLRAAQEGHQGDLEGGVDVLVGDDTGTPQGEIMT